MSAHMDRQHERSTPSAMSSQAGLPASTGASGWKHYPGLRLGMGMSRGKGRIQRQLRRAFIAHGAVISSSDAYRWCHRRQAREFGQWERWSITRVLLEMADQVGHSRGRGRSWIWRLKQEGTS
jgi:hypothetical protein